MELVVAIGIAGGFMFWLSLIGYLIRLVWIIAREQPRKKCYSHPSDLEIISNEFKAWRAKEKRA